MHRLLIALALLLLAPLASAQIYTWTDAGGTVHYAQAPPPEGTKYKEVKTSGSLQPQAAPAPVVAADSSGSSSSEGSAEPPKPVTDTPENRSKLCTSLKSNLAALNGSAPVVMQVNGKTTALDDSQRKQQATTAQSQYQQYCQSQ